MSAWHCKIQKQTVRRPDGIVFRGMPNPTGAKMSRAGRLPVLSCGFLQIQVLYSKAFGKTWQRKRLEIHIWTIYFSSTEARLFFGKDRNVLRSDRKTALFHNTGYNIPLFHLQERWSKGWKTKKSEPCKQDIEKSENQISKGYDPQIVIPMFFHDGPPKSLFY